jgi:type IV secretory pathway VirB2 component (pilin)
MKRQLMQGTIALSIAVAGLLAAGFATAQASPGHHQFGHHVVNCAHVMGFDGARNPGMHRVAAGWDGMDCEEAPH